MDFHLVLIRARDAARRLLFYRFLGVCIEFGCNILVLHFCNSKNSFMEGGLNS